MKVNHKITGAEREVMEVLWQRTEPMQTRELLEEMKERGKKWKRQTLNTLLFRLEEKGIVSRKRAYVEAALSQDRQREQEPAGRLDEEAEEVAWADGRTLCRRPTCMPAIAGWPCPVPGIRQVSRQDGAT